MPPQLFDLMEHGRGVPHERITARLLLEIDQDVVLRWIEMHPEERPAAADVCSFLCLLSVRRDHLLRTFELDEETRAER
jgi:hypothetical protein